MYKYVEFFLTSILYRKNSLARFRNEREYTLYNEMQDAIRQFLEYNNVIITSGCSETDSTSCFTPLQNCCHTDWSLYHNYCYTSFHPTTPPHSSLQLEMISHQSSSTFQPPVARQTPQDLEPGSLFYGRCRN